MKTFLLKHSAFVIFFLSLFLVTVFVVSGQMQSGGGFPLDDAWIHQTYARNLAASGQWSYTAGTVSGGSTSPLWTLLIAAADLISDQAGLWLTFVFSILLFSLTIWLGVKTLSALADLPFTGLLFAAFVLASEWHLLWAAGSGMETILYSALIMVLFFLLAQEHPRWAEISLFAGLILWVRPDGLTLLGPILLVFVSRCLQKKEPVRAIFALILPFIALLLAYITFNFATTGAFFPNTFYAKQQEYSILWTQPLLARIGQEALPVLTGTGIILLPGFIAAIVYAFRRRSVPAAGMILWILGSILVYAIRLPVTYQHGRYLIPIIPPYLVLGLLGMFGMLQHIRLPRWQKLGQFSWVTLTLCTAVAFYFTGLSAYRQDISLIDRLMVQPARWVAENIPTEKIIAVHDIGAMGYFSGHRLVDLAGLANPEVIPFMRDEPRLHRYLLEKDCAYFVGFSDWYSSSNQWGRVVQSFTASDQNQSQTVVIIDLQ
jgi:hypothetical protein